MAITTQCTGCGQTLSVKDEFAGRKGKCPTCGNIVQFPAAAPPPLSVEPVAAPPPAAESGSLFAAADLAQVLSAPPPEVPMQAAYAAEEPLDYAAPERPARRRSVSRTDVDPLILVGLGVTAFFLLLLWVSTMLPWRTFSFEQRFAPPGQPAPSFSIAGTKFGDGRLLFCLSLLLLALVGLHFLAKRTLPLIGLVAGAFGTLFFLMMLANLKNLSIFRDAPLSVGFGLFLGIFAAMGVMGGGILTAIRAPLPLSQTPIRVQQPFLEDFGALIAFQAAGFLLGLIYLLVRLIA